MSLLVEDWVSAASAKQRRGRAGRVRPGVCYGLYTRHRFEQRMKRYQVGRAGPTLGWRWCGALWYACLEQRMKHYQVGRAGLTWGWMLVGYF